MSYFKGCKLVTATDDRYTDGSIFYLWECPHCNTEFKATRYHLRGRSKDGNDAHCGCQTANKQAAMNIGRVPVNKLPDAIRVARQVLGASMARECSLSEEDVHTLIYNDCHYCGAPPLHSDTLGQGRWSRQSVALRNGIDRKDSAQGYHLNNCVPCCSTCNYMKREMSYNKFLAIVQHIGTRFKLNSDGRWTKELL